MLMKLNSLKKLNNSKLFEELYCLVLCLVSLLCWYLSSYAGIIVILVVAAASLFLFNDFKYMIPSILFFIFSNNSGFDIGTFPIPLIICGVLLFAVLIVFVVRNGFHIKKCKSCIGIALLSVSCLIPIIWYNIIPQGKGVLYFLYLTYFLYLLVYVLFAASLGKDSFRMLTIAMGYMGILLALECGIKVLELHAQNPDENILTFWYYLGWGLCNEAGIMMCVAVPFIFIQLIKSDTLVKVIINFAKIGLIAIGMLLTTSRGTYLFGFLEIVILLIWALFTSTKKKYVGFTTLGAFVVVLIGIQIVYGVPKLINGVLDQVFARGLDSNGREDIWVTGVDVWSTSVLTRMFGAGMVSKFVVMGSFNGIAEIYLVYHSTIFQTLVAFGIVGLIFLAVHLFEKYRQVFKFDKGIAGVLFIGYLMVDLYGLIDNTYSMYYYMIPLMITMASIDRLDKNDVNDLF